MNSVGLGASARTSLKTPNSHLATYLGESQRRTLIEGAPSPRRLSLIRGWEPAFVGRRWILRCSFDRGRAVWFLVILHCSRPQSQPTLPPSSLCSGPFYNFNELLARHCTPHLSVFPSQPQAISTFIPSRPVTNLLSLPLCISSLSSQGYTFQQQVGATLSFHRRAYSDPSLPLPQRISAATLLHLSQLLIHSFHQEVF